MPVVNQRVLPGFGLSLDYTVFYLSALVLLLLGACFLKAASRLPAQFLDMGLEPKTRRDLARAAAAEASASEQAGRPAPWPARELVPASLWLTGPGHVDEHTCRRGARVFEPDCAI